MQTGESVTDSLQVGSSRMPSYQLGDDGSTPPVVANVNFVLLTLPRCLSEETLKSGGSFYLVSRPGEIKDPTQGVNVYPVMDSSQMWIT